MIIAAKLLQKMPLPIRQSHCSSLLARSMTLLNDVQLQKLFKNLAIDFDQASVSSVVFASRQRYAHVFVVTAAASMSSVDCVSSIQMRSLVRVCALNASIRQMCLIRAKLSISEAFNCSVTIGENKFLQRIFCASR